MTTFTVSREVIGLVIVTAVAIVSGVWLLSVIARPDDNDKWRDEDVFVFFLFGVATFVAIGMAFGLAISGGVQT